MNELKREVRDRDKEAKEWKKGRKKGTEKEENKERIRNREGIENQEGKETNRGRRIIDSAPFFGNETIYKDIINSQTTTN